jgi:hypothetical protein
VQLPDEYGPQWDGLLVALFLMLYQQMLSTAKFLMAMYKCSPPGQPSVAAGAWEQGNPVNDANVPIS